MLRTEAIIIDDERLARLDLRTLLVDFPQIEVIAEAANVPEALLLIRAHQPKLLFLDINMPGASGFDLLEKLDFSPQVIFTTAYDEFAIQAFEANALDYLLKPIREERLARALGKLTIPQESLGNLEQTQHVFVRDGDKCHFIKMAEIQYFSSLGNYVEIHTSQEKAILKRSLNQIETKVKQQGFFRANRSEIINLDMINDIQVMQKGKLRVQLQSGKLIELSERKSVQFKAQLSL